MVSDRYIVGLELPEKESFIRCASSAFTDQLDPYSKGDLIVKTVSLFLAGLVATSLNCVLANPLPDPFEEPPSGGSVAIYRQKTPVSMERELVEVTLRENSAHVKGQYWLKNTSNEKVAVRTAFPDDSFLGPSKKSRLQNLKVTVDSRPYEVTYRENTRWDSLFDELDEHLIVISGLHCWTMHFSGEQERHVVIEYDCSTEWTYRATGEKTDIHRQFQYILKSGAGWAGKIGNAEIRIKLDDDSARHIIKLKPKNASWKGDIVAWKLRGFEPDSRYDIRVTYGAESYGSYDLKSGIDGVLKAIGERATMDSEKRESFNILLRHLGTKEILESLPQDDRHRRWIRILDGVE